MKRGIVYLRVSTQEQADSRLGLQSQEQLCRDFAARAGVEVVDVITDPGVSGSVPLYEREGGRRLLDQTRGGSLVIIALCQDRLFRSLIDCMATLERLDDLGVGVMLVDGGDVDVEDPEGWLKAAINALFAEYERRKVSLRTRRALAQARSNGKKHGVAPMGFANAARFEGGRKVDGGVHRPIPEEQAIVAQVVTMARETSYSEAARRLNARGVPTRTGRLWSAKTVRDVARRANASA